MAPSLESWTLTTQPLPPGSPSIEPAIHVEHNRQDRDPYHALPHPDEGAASRNCSARGKAAAQPQPARERKQSYRSRPAHAWIWAIPQASSHPMAQSARRVLSRKAFTRGVMRLPSQPVRDAGASYPLIAIARARR